MIIYQIRNANYLAWGRGDMLVILTFTAWNFSNLGGIGHSE
jgi:hypothetical protein